MITKIKEFVTLKSKAKYLVFEVEFRCRVYKRKAVVFRRTRFAGHDDLAIMAGYWRLMSAVRGLTRWAFYELVLHEQNLCAEVCATIASHFRTSRNGVDNSTLETLLRYLALCATIIYWSALRPALGHVNAV
jgi:hypothetical protein